MIKFFRKIRQGLLTENKFSKYLLYAIGEIMLVVIGILIAVTINNEVNQNNDSKKETKYLIALNKDILIIESELETTKLSLLKIKMACDSLIRAIHKPLTKPDNKKLNNLTSIMVSIPGKKIAFQSYNTLKNTSDLNLIESNQLKLSLSDIELAMSLFETSLKWQDKQWTDINQVYLNKKMDLLEISNTDRDEDYHINMKSIFNNDWNKILRDNEFSNIVINRKWAVIDIIKAQTALIKALDKCKQIIQQELDKK